MQVLFLANIPLVDTMYHALKAWCIFYWFHFDSQGRWGQKGQNVECSPRSLLSAVPEAFCRQIISGMSLENTKKKRTKTHACVFNTRVRFCAFVSILSCDTWLLRLFLPATVARHLLTFAGSDMPEKVPHAGVPPHLHE